MPTNSIWMNFGDRFDKVSLVVCLAFILQLFISYSLWAPSLRQYPIVPVFENFSLHFGAGFSFLLFWGFLTGLLVTAFCKVKKISIPILIAIYLIWVLQDVMRVQAWSYHYLLLLSLIFIHQFYKGKSEEILFLLRFIMAMTYIWTGFHKINLHFAEVVFPWLMGIFPALEKWGDIAALGYALAVFESLLGFGLLWKRSRKTAVILVILFHLIILVFLIADEWNYVVYPWNIVMIFLACFLFWDTAAAKEPKRYSIRKFWPAYCIFFLYGIAPALQPFNLWPYDLCQMMYTGLSLEMRVGFDEAAVSTGQLQNCVPKNIIRQISRIGDDKWSLNVDDWTMAEFNLPTYPAEWYYKKIGKSLCNCVVDNEGFIELVKKKRWNRQDELIRIPCKDLME